MPGSCPVLASWLSLALALILDYVSNKFPAILLKVYAIMFMAGGIIGLIGAFVLAKADEPSAIMEKENIFRMLLKPLRDSNFFRLLVFNSGWTFALNLATPFFVVFMLNTVGLSLAAIIMLTTLSQLASILTIRVWGKYADTYSNKTIIAISAPLYILCLLAWCFVGLYQQPYVNLLLLSVIHIITGISTAGINLSITNLGLKLAPKENAMIYLSARNLIVAIFGGLAPIVGGHLADFFSQWSFIINAEWTTPESMRLIPLIALRGWNFLFLAGALLAMIALEILVHVREVGEVEKELVVRIMRKSMHTSLKDFFIISTLISWQEQLWQIIKRRLTL